MQQELIDTQWDVNNIINGFNSSAISELIDTQWDVNILDAEGNVTEWEN